MVYPHTFRTLHSETRTTNSEYGEYHAKQKENRIKIQPPLLKILQHVDSNRKRYLKNITEAVEIKAVAGKMKHRSDLKAMGTFIENWLTRLGMKYECFNIGFHNIDGKRVRLPPVILASFGKDRAKKTVCAYMYVDVQDPDLAQWKVDPWTVTVIDKIMYGCGTAGGKIVLMCWLNLIEAFVKAEIEVPVNVKLIIESMHYQDSKGLEDFLALRKQDFLNNVDYVIVTDSQWIGDKHPCLIYGCVGILKFKLTVEKTESTSSDPKDDLVKICEKIGDNQGKILIPKFNEYVQQISPDEEQLYEAIRDFDVDEIRDALPDFQKGWDQVKLLMHFWRLPSINFYEIEECLCEKQDKNIFQKRFDIKIVPRQIMDTSIELALNYVSKLTSDLKIENKVNAELISASRPWVEDFRSPNYEAARRATIQVHKEDPNMIREDCDMKIINILSTIIEKNVLILPIGDKNIKTGEPNENMPLKNYYDGIKILGAYLFQVANIID